MPNDRMTIACVIHSLSGGGAERVMASLASRLADRGHLVHLITLDDGNSDRHAVDPGVFRHRLDVLRNSTSWMQSLKYGRRRLSSLRKTLTQIRPDSVLSFCDATNLTTLLATRATGLKTVVSERSDPSQQKLGFAKETLRKILYRRAAEVVVQTDAVANYLSRRIGRSVKVIPSAVDDKSLSALRNWTAAWVNQEIVGVGRLEFEKGFDRLIEAFDAIADDCPGWTLKIVGDGSQSESLKAQVQRCQRVDRVVFQRWTRPISSVYQAASIFVLPSRYEGFPAALLEAMASGMPVVAVDCPSGPAAIVHSELDGLLVDDSIAAMAAGIRRLIQDEALAERLAQRATLVSERFSWDEMVTAYENLLVLNR